MVAGRLNIDGYVDYSFATFEEIVTDIRSFVVYIPKINKKLLKLRGKVVTNSSRLDNPKSILNYIDHCMLLFEGFKNDFIRLIVESPDQLKKQHIDILKGIVGRSAHEESYCCVGFKREHIARELKDISLRYLVDDIYVVTRDLLSLFGNLGDIIPRLEIFYETAPQKNKILIQQAPGSIPKDKTKKNILKNIVLFPTPAGSSWNDVRIHFLSNVAVEIRVGDERAGQQYNEIGFMDERNRKPSILWLVLASFGKHNGEISRLSTGLNNRITKNLKSHIHRIRNILQQLFKISHETPFEYKNFPSPSRYVAKFHVALSNEDLYDEIAEDFNR